MPACHSAASAASPQVSKLHCVDLAGSERLARSEATGAAKGEAITINSGLLVIGKV